ncbi:MULTISPECIES: PGAP1-like alpha/beta domain-containing protein [unclassified Saccharicrinis]|uniref:PGAP1-like alpha/beta domain-containing protein n=1 Tax=unclassified Saccharicrinis TaxID=2646859 RepID=UPI003D349AA4
MKKVIIGIHGLGNKPPKYLLQKWWKDAINEGLKRNHISKSLPVFELVYWADILYEKPLNKWEKDDESPCFLNEPYQKSLVGNNNYNKEDNSFRESFLDFVTEQLNKVFLNDDNTLNYSFIYDVILKSFFKDLDAYYTVECKDSNDITCKARNLIRKRLVDCIKKYPDHEILIIAHSMGSIVAFDVLSFVIPEMKINTLITMGSPLGLPVVVGKIAAEQKKTLNYTAAITSPSSITKSWFNIADVFDKVALDNKLYDNFTTNKWGVLPVDFIVSNDYEINGKKNPHKSFGYLRTVEVSKIIADFIGEEKRNIWNKTLYSVQSMVYNTRVKYKNVMTIIKTRINGKR